MRDTKSDQSTSLSDLPDVEIPQNVGFLGVQRVSKPGWWIFLLGFERAPGFSEDPSLLGTGPWRPSLPEYQ